MPKLSDLTTATPASGDLIPIVDVSDTTDDAAGSSKKCTVADLLPASGGDFGSIDVKTTGTVAPGACVFGSAPAVAGDIRIDSATRTVIAARNSADTEDRPILMTTYDVGSGHTVYFGTNTSFSTQVGNLKFYAVQSVAMGLSGATKLFLTNFGLGVYQGVNLLIYGGAASVPAAGGGVGVVAIANAGTVPASMPTGGGVLYAEGGALKWKGSDGTVTTIAPA